MQRTNASIPLYQNPRIQEVGGYCGSLELALSINRSTKALERVLYCWAIRHPASGYVQGINDLVTPFFQVFLQSYVSMYPSLFLIINIVANAWTLEGDVERTDVDSISQETLNEVEADCFWCLSKLLDGIQVIPISNCNDGVVVC